MNRTHPSANEIIKFKWSNFVFAFSQQKPEANDWTGCLHAMRIALQLEKNVNQALIDLHKLSDNNEDAQVSGGI